jgi:lysozyme family protein
MNETRFDACLAEVLKHEGGYVDHPDDPGGATNMGITLRTLADWRGVATLAKAEVRNLTRAEAERIYRTRYWNTVLADDLPVGIDQAVFDFAVNSGPDRAIRTLQGALGVAADGIIGPHTRAALRLRPSRALVDNICDRRLAFLRTLSTFAVFGRGWTSRVEAVRQAARAAIDLQPQKRNPALNMLTGYKTYIVAAIMLLAGLAQVLGIELPALDGDSAGHLIMEALAVIFLRKGLTSVVRN